MIKTLGACLLLLLGRPAIVLAEDRAPQAVSANASADALGDDDVYYAPIDDVAADTTEAVAASASAQTLPQGSFLSHARFYAYDLSTGKTLQGAELFMDGTYVGNSPLDLTDHLVGKPVLSLSARMDGYSEGLRPAVQFPAEGAVSVALVADNAASWYTTPAWVVGLGLLAASALTYDNNRPSSGLAAAGGGLAVISLSQLGARFIHLPALRRRAKAINEHSEPAPPMDRQP